MQEISIFVLFKIARKRILALFWALLIAGGLAFAYCNFLVTPVYSASVSIIVTNGAVVSTDEAQTSQKVLGSDVQASLLLVDSIVDMLKTPDIYMYLSKNKLSSKITYGTLMANTTVARRGEDTLFVDISYRNTDPKEAIKIANLFATASCDYIKDFIPNSKPKVVSKADKASLVAPRTLRTTVLVGVAAAFVLYCGFVLVELLNNTIKDEEDFSSRYSIPVLGTIPDFEEARKVSSYKKGGYYK